MTIKKFRPQTKLQKLATNRNWIRSHLIKPIYIDWNAKHAGITLSDNTMALTSEINGLIAKLKVSFDEDWLRSKAAYLAEQERLAKLKQEQK